MNFLSDDEESPPAVESSDSHVAPNNVSNSPRPLVRSRRVRRSSKEDNFDLSGVVKIMEMQLLHQQRAMDYERQLREEEAKRRAEERAEEKERRDEERRVRAEEQKRRDEQHMQLMALIGASLTKSSKN